MNAYVLDPRRRDAMSFGFQNIFGGAPTAWFSAPGRTEIGGNHTDHQQGKVLAAAVNLDTVAAVRENELDVIRVKSEGYPMCTVALDDLAPRQVEEGTSLSLIRGVAARFSEMGCTLRGFDAYVTSQVLPGSGLSSSAAFEVLIGTIIGGLFFAGAATAAQIAMAAQYSENHFFGKPCGLMDQMASAVGNLVAIDFADQDHPIVTPIPFDFSKTGHALCIIDTGASHADLTEAYADIPRELKAICAHFGKAVLTQVPEEEFYAAIPQLREACGDRAVLRAIHVYEENKRVDAQVEALHQGDFDRFLALVRASGQSSYMYLQNVIPEGAAVHQEMALTLALCGHVLGERGAFRVHGGGFAGTVQAFVPLDLLEEFRRRLEAVLGEGACHVLSIRPWGCIAVEEETV